MSVRARLSSFLALLLAGAAVLFAGLVPGVLETGRVDPLDWLMPAGAALLALILFESRGGMPPAPGRLGLLWAVLALPLALMCAQAGSRLPWAGLALFGLGLAVAAVLLALAVRRGRAARWAVAAALMLALLGVGPIAGRLTDTWTGRSHRPTVGVLSALPLYGAPSGGGDVLRGVGLRSPLWRALEVRLRLRPLDALEGRAVQGLDSLLLAQPRVLAPAELVTLDRWVREGGHAVILADADLRWPDDRPLGDPRHAPRTSALGTLLTHWGLTLAPVSPDGARGIERRVLADGALLQLAGASRFTSSKGAACALEDQGLIARCRVGRGTALLMADADWINDDLWTLDPAHPLDRAQWTSDAVPMLSHWLGGGASEPTLWRSWLAGEAPLVSALREALLLLVLLALAAALIGPFPMIAHGQGLVGHVSGRGQNRNVVDFRRESR